MKSKVATIHILIAGDYKLVLIRSALVGERHHLLRWSAIQVQVCVCVCVCVCVHVCKESKGLVSTTVKDS